MDRAEYVFTKLSFFAPFAKENDPNAGKFSGTAREIGNRAVGVVTGGAGGAAVGGGLGYLAGKLTKGSSGVAAGVGALGGSVLGLLSGERAAVRKGEDISGHKKSNVLHETGRAIGTVGGMMAGSLTGSLAGGLVGHAGTGGSIGRLLGGLGGFHLARQSMLRKKDEK